MQKRQRTHRSKDKGEAPSLFLALTFRKNFSLCALFSECRECRKRERERERESTYNYLDRHPYHCLIYATSVTIGMSVAFVVMIIEITVKATEGYQQTSTWLVKMRIYK